MYQVYYIISLDKIVLEEDFWEGTLCHDDDYFYVGEFGKESE